MFEQIEDPKEQPDDKKRTDYTGLKIVGLIAPVYLIFVYVDKPDMGLAVSIVLGMTILAIKIRWDLRRHAWFWTSVALVLALHVYLLMRLPQRVVAALGPLHAIGLLPIEVADLFITLGVIWVGEKLFTNDSLSDDGSA